MSDKKPDFVPPHNYEAEAGVLGSILIDKEAILKVADLITPEDFYRESHGAIFDAMLALYGKSEPIDAISLSDRLNAVGALEKSGGQTYLAQLAEAVTTASHVFHYAKIVQRDATLRRLIGATHDISRMAFDGGEGDIASVLDQAEQRLFGVSQKHLKQNFVPIRNVLNEAFDRIDELHRGEKGKLRGVPTGYKTLDNLLGGLQASDLVILAARPACGKTSLALDIARNIAVRAKRPVAIFSLEMSKEQLVDRMICAEANVNLWKMRTGRLSDRAGDDDFPRIGHALGVLSGAPIFIDDSANVNIMEIRTKLRRLQKEHGQLGLVVIDYLQLMESQTKIENRVQEVAAITRALKGIARELNVPVLALSQLSRAVEMSKPAIPKLAHLRESGSIEQDADVVMFIYRKAADRNYRIEDLAPEERHLAEIHVAKHRNGPNGICKLHFKEDITSFTEMAYDSVATPLEIA